ncbi:carbohydrate-binding module 48 [Leptospira ryugenii]|uniref:Carbohydrate-binding module 48 n=2 Tax=Leptospira ryugenii TaxID=1917863 RepID=A0A2P2E4C4_9LEPT|nr:carbohydrate-binding module 48 [Leptospira ryugenii]
MSLLGQETLDWVGGFSSDQLEMQEEEENQDTVYYLWQLESLKKNISPRYIRYLDVESYLKTNRLLKRGILFTYNGLRDDSVELCGNFSNWTCLPMKRNQFGIYYYVLEPEMITAQYEDDPIYEYKFRVGGILTFDPENLDKVEDGSGSFISRYVLNRKDTNRQIHSLVLEDSASEEYDFRTVKFQIYKPDAEVVSLVGDFNDWNPENDFLKKDRNGIFSLEKKLLPNQEYHYRFIVDGEYMLDTYNPISNVKTDTSETVSSIYVPTRSTELERKE